MDIYNPQGTQYYKVHLFVASNEGEDKFDDLGQVCSSSVSEVDGLSEVECIAIGVPENYEYQLSHKAFLLDHMVQDKEETMFSRGLKLDKQILESTADDLQDAIILALKGGKGTKPLKSLGGKQTKSRASVNASVVDVDEAILRSAMEGTSSEPSKKLGLYIQMN